MVKIIKMKSKFVSKCHECKQKIQAGEEIIWLPKQKNESSKVFHLKCFKEEKHLPANDARISKETSFAVSKIKPSHLWYLNEDKFKFSKTSSK